MVNLPIDANDPSIDSLGHLGGAITGMIMGFVLTENKSKSYMGTVALIVYFALMFTLFYTL